MKGDSVTAIVDCKRQQTRPLPRASPSALSVSTSGIILLAQQIDDDTFFQGDLQQLRIAAGPEAAYQLCEQHVPDCDRPLPLSPGQRRRQQQEQQGDEALTASYRGMDEDELLNREGLTPREYLEFTENEQLIPRQPEQNDTVKIILCCRCYCCSRKCCFLMF